MQEYEVLLTGVDAYQKRQWQNHHTADVLIDASLFGADIYYESHYKESMTQHIFDH